MTEIYAVYGASGCGRSLMPVARQQLQRQNINAEIYFIDDSLIEEIMINGHIALNYAAFKNLKADRKSVLIAIANSQIRETVQRLTEDQIQHFRYTQASNNVILDEVHMGEGSLLCPFTCLTSNTKLENSFMPIFIAMLLMTV